MPVVEAEYEPIVSKRLRRRPLFAAAAALGLVAATAVLVLRGESATKSEPQASIATPETVTTPPQTATPPPAPKKKPVAPAVRRGIQVNWRPVKFATFYHVVFVRGGRQLDVLTPRSTLPVKSLRSGRGLRPGRYSWSVRPGYGNFRLRRVPGRTFYGPVVSRGVLLVPRRAS